MKQSLCYEQHVCDNFFDSIEDCDSHLRVVIGYPYSLDGVLTPSLYSFILTPTEIIVVAKKYDSFRARLNNTAENMKLLEKYG